MQLTDYLTPLWVNVLITVGDCLIGGGLVCLGVYLGINAGFDEAIKNEKKRRKEDEL